MPGADEISTKIALSGEQEYRQGIDDIVRAQKLLSSEMAITRATFDKSDKSAAALTARNEDLEKSLVLQREKVELCRKALENASTVFGEADKRTIQWQKNLNFATAAVVGTENAIREGVDALTAMNEAAKRSGLDKLERDITNSAAAISTTKTELGFLREQLKGEWSMDTFNRAQEVSQRNVQETADHVALLKQKLDYLEKAGVTDENRAGFERLKKEILEVGDAARKAEREFAELTNTEGQMGAEAQAAGAQSVDAVGALSSALAAAGVTMAIKEIVTALRDCVAASMEFESAVTGVFKTVDGTDAQLAAISDGIKQMSTEIPSTTTEIAAVAEAAGQLGIATSDVLGFTRVMLDLGQSTNLSAEEAAASLAKFANITGTAAGDYERLGSVIVGLGNNFATTEADIVAMATRLASTGTLTGLSEAQIMALATALSSVGVEAEAGGSAISKLLKEFEVMVATGSDKLGNFASVAGMSAAEFSAAWSKDAVGALSAFIAGLGRIDAAGGSSVATLEGLGLTETRLSNATLALASSGGLMADAVNMANQAWKENTALTEEAGKWYETLESKTAMLANSVNLVRASIADALDPALEDIAETGTDAFTWAAEVIAQNPWLVQVLTGLTTAVSVLTVGVVGLTAALKVAQVMQTAFLAVTSSAAMPVIAVAAAVAGLVVALGTFAAAAAETNENLTESQKAYRDTKAALQEQRDGTLELVAALEALTDKEHKTSAEKASILDMVGKLNEAVPNLSLAYDEQTESITLTTEAIRDMVLAEMARAEQEASIQQLTKLYQEQIANEVQMKEAEEQLADAKERLAAAESEQIFGTIDQARKLGEYRLAVGGAEQAVTDCTDAQNANAAEIAALKTEYDRLTGAIAENTSEVGSAEITLLSFNGVLTKVQGGYDLLTKAQQEMSDSGYLSLSTVSSLLEKYPDLAKYLVETADGYQLSEGALQDYMAAQRAEYTLAANNAQTAAQDIVAAEIEKRGAIVDTTQSIKDQIKALIAFYGDAKRVTEQFSAAYKNSDDFYAHGGIIEQKSNDLENMLHNLEAAEKNLAAFDRVSASLGRDTGKKSSGGGGGSGKGKTQAELELEAYQECVHELDRQRAMEEISEDEYYTRKENLGKLYLQNNKDEREALAQELFDYRKGAYDRDVSELDKALKFKEISYTEHGQRMAALQSKFLTEGSDAWKENEQIQAADRASAYQEKVDALDQALENEEITYMERAARLQTLEGEAQAVSAEALRENKKLQAEDRNSAYSEEVADQKYFLDMGIISQTEFYEELRRLQHEFLEEDSEEWRRASVELHQYEEQMRQEALAAAQEAYEAEIAVLKKTLDEKLSTLKDAHSEELSALKDGLSAENTALKEAHEAQKEAAKAAHEARKEEAKAAYEAKTSAIKAELQAEKDRLNAIVEGIDAEIQARRELREDEDQDDAIERAQKKLDAAKNEFTFARTDEEKKQWSDEIIRAQQALDEAKKQKEDTAFFREKELEKDGVKDQIDAAQGEADQKLDAAAKDYDAATKRMEADYKASIAVLEANYKASAAALEADYNARIAAAEATYKAAAEQLKQDYESSVSNVGGGGQTAGKKPPQKEYSQEVHDIAKANNASLSDAQDMYNANQWYKDLPGYKPYASVSAVSDIASRAARAVAGATAAAAAAGAGVAVRQVSNISNNRSANLTINQAPVLTSGQIEASVRKVLNSLDR